MNSRDTCAVVIREVGLRDGLQSISRTLAGEHKLEWLRGAHAAGLREIAAIKSWRAGLPKTMQLASPTRSAA